MSGAGASLGQTQDDNLARLPTSLESALKERDARRSKADEPEPQDEPQDEPDDSSPGHLRGEFDANLALNLSDFQLSNISMELLRGIDADIKSRTEWESIAEKAIEYLGLKMEAASTDVNTEGSVSKVFHTLLLESAVYFWANAHAELLPASGPCKVRDDHPTDVSGQPVPTAQSNPSAIPPDGLPPVGGNAPSPINRADLASAFELDMNHYLTAVDRQYYRDFSRMLFSLGPMGTEFRKVYWCPQRKRPVSEWVKGLNLIVSNDAADLSTAGRVTERIMMRQNAVKRLQLSGWWRNCVLGTPVPTTNRVAQAAATVTGITLNQQLPADYQHTIYECYAELNIPGFEHEDDEGVTGLPLPYRVTVDKDSKQVLEIRRNWKQDDPNFLSRKRYVMYGMVPGLGFYYLGYIHLLGNTQRALTAIERQLLDAGQYANFPGFLYGKGAIKGTNEIRVPPGGGQEINIGDKPITNIIMPLPYKDISPGLLKLSETLASDGRKLSSIAEMPVGEGRADVPVGTVVAMIEQTTKVMNAVHKGLHASMQEELLLLKEQFAEDPEALWAFAKSPARKWEQAQEFSDVDLVPASDPNVPSQLHRTMQSMALFQIAQQAAPLGILNLKEVMERMFRTLNIQDIEALFANPTQMPQPPQQGQQGPDPVAMAKVNLMGVEQQRKAASEQQQTDLQRWETGQRAQQDREDNMVKLRIAEMEAQKEQHKLLLQLHQTNRDDYNKHLDRQHEMRSALVQHGADAHNAEADRQNAVRVAAMKPAPKPSGGND